MSSYVPNRSCWPKIDPPCQLQQFSSTGNFFIFKIFEKRVGATPWSINFPKIWSECALKIKTKSRQVWASYGKRFLIGSCEFGHLDLWGPPGLIGLMGLKESFQPKFQFFQDYLFISWLQGPHYTLINWVGGQWRNILPAAFNILSDRRELS